MADEKTESAVADLRPLPRENMIATAVKFLQNREVQGSSVNQKKSFLIKKGLTEEEIRAAFEKTGHMAQVQPEKQTSSVWQRLKDFFSSAVLFGGLGYAIYHVYKKFVEPFLFGPSEQETQLQVLRKSISQLEERIGDITKGVDAIQVTLTDHKEDVKQIVLDSATNRGPTEFHKLQDAQALNELKSEITSVKGLLLSRNQFPQTPKFTPVLPTWQLSSSETAKNQDEGKVDDEPNSNSSEGNLPNVLPVDAEAATKGELEAGAEETNHLNGSVTDSESLQKPAGNTSVDSDFQNGVVVGPLTTKDVSKPEEVNPAELDSAGTQSAEQ